MKKSYRRAARRRHVTIRLPRLLADLLLLLHGHSNDKQVPSSHRRQVLEHEAASILGWFLSQHFDECMRPQPDWTRTELMRWYSGIPTLSESDLDKCREKYAILAR